MSYYDHATAMALKLDRWGDDRPLRNYEREALACAQRKSTKKAKKKTMLQRCLMVFRRHST